MYDFCDDIIKQDAENLPTYLVKGERIRMTLNDSAKNVGVILKTEDTRIRAESHVTNRLKLRIIFKRFDMAT